MKSYHELNREKIQDPWRIDGGSRRRNRHSSKPSTCSMILLNHQTQGRERERERVKYDLLNDVVDRYNLNASMGMPSRNTAPSRSTSCLPRGCVPLLVFFSIFAFLFFFNVDTFMSRTKAIARHSFNEQTQLFMNAEGGNLHREFEITWGEGRAKVHNNGGLLTLSLDRNSGSGFRSKNEYLFGKIEMQIKLISGNSAGTVTTYYLSSEGDTHDEIDFEFLGNSSGDPYTLHTNVYCQGKGNREQQFFLWFDPTADFHTYSVLWNPQRIVFSVDGTAIREFTNMESKGIPFPKDQPMRVYSSLWNADDWATRGGLIKTDWSKAPFTASYRNYKADACIWSAGASSCSSSSANGNTTDASWSTEKLNMTSIERMKWVQKNHMVYNYCIDKMRFAEGLPPECKVS